MSAPISPQIKIAAVTFIHIFIALLPASPRIQTEWEYLTTSIRRFCCAITALSLLVNTGCFAVQKTHFDHTKPFESQALQIGTTIQITYLQKPDKIKKHTGKIKRVTEESIELENFEDIVINWKNVREILIINKKLKPTESILFALGGTALVYIVIVLKGFHGFAYIAR